MKKIRAWAIECDDGKGGRMFAARMEAPRLFKSRLDCREEISQWKEEDEDNLWKARPVRVLVTKEKA